MSEKIKAIIGDWYEHLGDEFTQDYMKQLSRSVQERRKVAEVFPSSDNVFNAYRLTQYKDVKVVILGQDPYYTPFAAHGLSFSVENSAFPKLVRTPPSLVNIFKEIEDDIYNGFKLEQDTNLTRWAEQGVFLLNTVLTVEKGSPLSHGLFGWQKFTGKTIDILNEHNNKIVFLCFGAPAKEACKHINRDKHLVIETSHPSPLSAHRGFLGSKCFSKANAYLKKHYNTEIKW